MSQTEKVYNQPIYLVSFYSKCCLWNKIGPLGGESPGHPEAGVTVAWALHIMSFFAPSATSGFPASEAAEAHRGGLTIRGPPQGNLAPGSRLGATDTTASREQDPIQNDGVTSTQFIHESQSHKSLMPFPSFPPCLFAGQRLQIEAFLPPNLPSVTS